jgi:PAS domain-containing protein
MEEVKRILRGQAIPVLAVALACITTLVLWPLGQPVPFVPFIAAVIVGAWQGGLRGSLVSTGLSVLALAILDSLQAGPQRAETSQEFVLRLGLFAFMGVAAGYLAMHCRKAVAAHDRLQHTLASAGEAWIFTDPQGRITFLNSLAQAWMGWDLPQARQRPLDQLFVLQHDGSQDPIALSPTQVLEQRTPMILPPDAVLLPASGTAIPVEGCLCPIQNAEDRVIELMLTLRDVAPARRAAQKTAVQLQQAEMTLSQVRSEAQARIAELTGEQEKAKASLAAVQDELSRRLRDQEQQHASVAAAHKKTVAELERRLREQAQGQEATTAQLHKANAALEKQLCETQSELQSERTRRQEMERQHREAQTHLEGALQAKQQQCDHTSEECLNALAELETLRRQAADANALCQAAVGTARKELEGRIEHLETIHRAALAGARRELEMSQQAELCSRQEHSDLVHRHHHVAQRSDFLAALLDACPHGLLAFDQERRITFWNPALVRLTGKSSAEVLGQPLQSIFPDLATAESMQHRSWSLDRISLSDLLAGSVLESSKRGRIAVTTAPLACIEPEGGLAVIWEMQEAAPRGKVGGEATHPRLSSSRQSELDWLAFN